MSDPLFYSESYKPSSSRTEIFSPNFSDKTTWYYESVRVVDEEPTPDGGRIVWTLAHSPVIDVTHGKITGEDNLVSSYGMIVEVDDVAQTEDAPFGVGGDGDYSVDYDNGTITFADAVPSESTVTVTYSYENGSKWKLIPDEGKKLFITVAECQFSNDFEMNDSLKYEIYFGEYVVKSRVYKTFYDFVNESNGVYPQIPAIGGSSRGISQPITTLPWDYIARTPLYSSYGMQVHIFLENDIPCSGECAVITFYCTSEDE